MPLSLKQSLRQLANRFTQYLLGNKAQLDFEQLIQDGVLHVGRHTYGWPVIEAYQGSEAKVWIGNFCSISKDVVFVTGGIHPPGWVSTYPFRIRWNLPGKYEDGMPGTKGDILVGSDVWIGTGAMILSGVKIGDGAVVAARSVVTRDVPPFAVVGGVPARVIRYRFDPETIDCLLQMKWWEWDDETLRENIHFLSSDNVAGFIQSWKESRSAE